jgi:4-alpha-glucanotransferase
VPEFPGLHASGMAEEVGKLRQAKLVEYRGVARAKMRALELAFGIFRQNGNDARRREFDAFRRDRGEALSRFACFEWLRHRCKGPWRDWPTQWRKPGEEALVGLRRTNKAAIEFFEYLQWIAARQLDHCSERTRQLGLPIGLYLDIAVGARPEGFDAWSNQDSILPEVTIGAPPDALNTAGQNWGLAGVNPNGLERRGFEPFRRVLATSMRHAGAIRLDHVLGLKRLYLIPRDMSPDRGAYVQFPFEALLAVAAQESVQSKCIVIGEDLGTVPEHFREQLADWGIWSYQVMLFERAPDGSFLPPEGYRETALVSFSTHDLPTFAGWTQGLDLAVKRSLGINPGESHEDRVSALAAMRSALSARGIPAMDFLSVTKYLAATPSRLLVVALEDALQVKDQVNMPGTINEHPNWRRRLPVRLEDLKHQPSLAAVAAIMAAQDRSSARQA